jgi:hypothetical protein
LEFEIPFELKLGSGAVLQLDVITDTQIDGLKQGS